MPQSHTRNFTLDRTENWSDTSKCTLKIHSMIIAVSPQSVRSGQVYQCGWGWPEPAGGGGRLRWPGWGHGSPAGCEGKTKHHRCHVWAAETNHRPAEGLRAGASWCGPYTVSGEDWCSIASDSFYKQIFFLLLLPAETESFILPFLWLPTAHLCSVLILLAIHHPFTLLPCFYLLLFIFLSRYLPVYLSVHLQELPEKWNNVRKQAVLVKQQVAPLQAIEVAGLRRKCASFDVEQHTFREHFCRNGPFR